MKLVTTKSECKLPVAGVRIKSQREITKRIKKSSVVKYAIIVKPHRVDAGMLEAIAYMGESFENDFSTN